MGYKRRRFKIKVPESQKSPSAVADSGFQTQPDSMLKLRLAGQETPLRKSKIERSTFLGKPESLATRQTQEVQTSVPYPGLLIVETRNGA